jgi:hypothetical protein
VPVEPVAGLLQLTPGWVFEANLDNGYMKM